MRFKLGGGGLIFGGGGPYIRGGGGYIRRGLFSEFYGIKNNYIEGFVMAFRVYDLILLTHEQAPIGQTDSDWREPSVAWSVLPPQTSVSSLHSRSNFVCAFRFSFYSPNGNFPVTF